MSSHYQGMSYYYHDTPVYPAKPLEWAKENCASFLHITIAINGVMQCYYRFYFAKEDDQVMFALRWS